MGIRLWWGYVMFQISLAGTVENYRMIRVVLLAFSPFPHVLFSSTHLSDWLDDQGGAGQRTRRPVLGPMSGHEVWQLQGSPLVSHLLSIARATYSIKNQVRCSS